MKTTGIILAGGKSTRLGRNKALEPVLGKRLVQYVYDCLKPLADQVFIVTSKDMAALPYPEGAAVLTDIYPDKGPLSGIYTGLASAKHEYNIVVGCDMPFLNEKLLRHMVGECRGFDAVVPRPSPSTMEPLHAVYSRSCLDRMKSQLEKERLKTLAFFEQINVKYISMQECRTFDPELMSFININNQADLDKSIALARHAAKEEVC
ncbi:MAG: molybdenum cofactor guanylyltransferase [Dehalococcoidales bacterium]|nr:molybdenum cofactor guanylyltransferase [Dehalococcoidales bacterium]